MGLRVEVLGGVVVAMGLVGLGGDWGEVGVLGRSGVGVD